MFPSQKIILSAWSIIPIILSVRSCYTLYIYVEKFRYLGATVTNTNDVREEIKRRISMGNACYYSIEKILSSLLLLYYQWWPRWLKRQGAWLRAGRPGFDPGCRRGGDFSSFLRVQTGPGVHSTSYKIRTGVFPRG